MTMSDEYNVYPQAFSKIIFVLQSSPLNPLNHQDDGNKGDIDNEKYLVNSELGQAEL